MLPYLGLTYLDNLHVSTLDVSTLDVSTYKINATDCLLYNNISDFNISQGYITTLYSNHHNQ
jgi:hypothetical protein